MYWVKHLVICKLLLMKGVNFVTNESNQKVAVQIDIKLLEKYNSHMEDLLDGIIAESRKNEPRSALTDVIKSLKKSGEIK